MPTIGGPSRGPPVPNGRSARTGRHNPRVGISQPRAGPPVGAPRLRLDRHTTWLVRRGRRPFSTGCQRHAPGCAARWSRAACTARSATARCRAVALRCSDTAGDRPSGTPPGSSVSTDELKRFCQHSWRPSAPCATTSVRRGTVSRLNATARSCAIDSNGGRRLHVWRRQSEDAIGQPPLRQSAVSSRPAALNLSIPSRTLPLSGGSLLSGP
jgi:hypothetical protein